MANRPLNEIAAEIRGHWKNIDRAAAQYLEAMETIRSLDDEYRYESAVEIVSRFLSLAHAWRGETARRIKAELTFMLRAHE